MCGATDVALDTILNRGPRKSQKTRKLSQHEPMESRWQDEENTGILTKSAINDRFKTSAWFKHPHVGHSSPCFFSFVCVSLWCIMGIIGRYHRFSMFVKGWIRRSMPYVDKRARFSGRGGRYHPPFLSSDSDKNENERMKE